MKLSKLTAEAVKDVVPTGPLTVELADGQRGTIDAADVNQVLSTGGRVISQADLDKESRLAEAAESPGTAFAASALREATLGLSDQIITKTGLASPEELVALEEANPTATTLGQGVGFAAPFIIPGGGLSKIGKVAQAAPIILAEKAGVKAAQLAGKALSKTTSKVVENAVKLGAGSAVEGAIYGVGQVISEDALGKAELNAENLLANAARSGIVGGALGGAFGALTPSAVKLLEKTKQQANKFISEVAEKGDVGIIKWAGADKKEFRKIFKRNDLSEKDIADHILSLTKGQGDDLGGLLRTNIDDVAQGNSAFMRDAGDRMDTILSKVDDEFNIQKNTNLSAFDKNLVYGEDLAQLIENGPLKEMGDIISPRKDALKKFANDLRELGVERDPLGNIVSRSALTPSSLKSQSVEFGKLAKFDATVSTPIREAYAEGRFILEKKLQDFMDQIDNNRGLSEAYKSAKKDYAKGALTQDILENGMQRIANNRGMSLTEGISAGTGAVLGGIPGAVAGYAARKFSREQGDKLASFVLRKIEKANNAGKINISETINGFMNAGAKAGKIANRAALRGIVGGDVIDVSDIEEKVSYYSQSPEAIVTKFAENNEDLFNVAPQTAQALQDRIVKSAEFLGSKLPKKDDSPFQDTPISRSELQKFKNYVEAAENPFKVLKNLKDGYFTPESGEVFKVIYPEMYTEIRNEFMNRVQEFKNLNEKQKAALSVILEMDTRKAFTPNGFMTLQNVSGQGIARDLAGQMPKKVPVTGAKNLNQSQRSASGLDRVINRQ